MNAEQLLFMMPSSSFEERAFLKTLIDDKTEEDGTKFINYYLMQRKDPQMILIFTLFGFVGVAGIQRFILDEPVLGIIYFITGGFCGVGTIIDVVRNKSLTLEYNKRVAHMVYHTLFK